MPILPPPTAGTSKAGEAWPFYKRIIASSIDWTDWPALRAGYPARGVAARTACIVEAASDLIYANGAERTSLDDVMAASGVSKSQCKRWTGLTGSPPAPTLRASVGRRAFSGAERSGPRLSESGPRRGSPAERRDRLTDDL
jgi:hypothetical protein